MREKGIHPPGRKLMAALMIAGLLGSGHSIAAERQGKITGTGGVSSISGAGGGLTPWATLSTYAADSEYGAAVFHSRVKVDDYQLAVSGAVLNLHDRIEISHARQEFFLDAADISIIQKKTGLRYKAAGDIIYGQLPQITLGLEHGNLQDKGVARSVGARSTSGTDYTVSIGRA